jgi:hypothetical protein
LNRKNPLQKQRVSSIELSFDYAARALRANHQLSFLFPADVALYDIIIGNIVSTLIILSCQQNVNIFIPAFCR